MGCVVTATALNPTLWLQGYNKTVVKNRQQCADADARKLLSKDRQRKTYSGTRGRDTSEWMMKREKLSPRYTTSITEIPTVCT